jgi:hypothetical protein
VHGPAAAFELYKRPRSPRCSTLFLFSPFVGLAALAMSWFEARIPDLQLWIRCSRVSTMAIIPLHWTRYEHEHWLRSLSSPSHHDNPHDNASSVITTGAGSALGSASMRCNLANRRNASRRRSWLLPGCVADGLRVGGFPGKFPCAIRLWQESLPLFLADLRREGPISAYVAVTDCGLGPSEAFVEHLCGPNTKSHR